MFDFATVRAIMEERIAFMKDKQTDKEILAISRYIVSIINKDDNQLSNQMMRSHIILILDLIVTRIRQLLYENELDRLGNLKINFWKSLMSTQIKNIDLFIELLKRYYPLIYSKTNFNHPSEEYKKLIELVSCSRSYMTQKQYNSLLSINNFEKILLDFAH